MTVSALTLGTGDAVLAATGSLAVALGAAGVVGGLGAEAFSQARSGCFDGWGFADSAFDGGTFGLQVGSLLDLAQSGMNAAPGGRRVPNQWGARGKPSTQALNERVAQQLKDAGYEITNGGNKLPEEYIPGPGGGRVGSVRPDTTASNGDDTVRVQTVDTRAGGWIPDRREMRNIGKLLKARRADGIFIVPKDD